MSRIFISYRREDSVAYAGRLCDRLQAHFGREQVFMDIDTLKPGEDFVDTLQKTVASCDALVAIIGPHWLNARAEDEKLRLEDPEDFVRLEIAGALERGIRVIPVLVGGAAMPESNTLPEDLKKLARRHAVNLTDIGFRQSVDSLIETLQTAVKAAQEQRGQHVNSRDAGEEEIDERGSSKEAIEVHQTDVPSDFSTPCTTLDPENAERSQDAAAMASLGRMYAEGKGVIQDFRKAREWFEKSAAAGSADGMVGIGELFYFGQGVSQDYQQARVWFEKAAAVGSGDGMYCLGVLFYVGQGVSQDYHEACAWFKKAAQAGDADAMHMLGVSYRDGSGVEQDYGRARTWFERAAASGAADAMTRLGELYRDGTGVKKNYQHARVWFEKAAAAGDADAMSWLGVLYRDGLGVKKSYDLARAWFRKAAAGGDAESMACLGELYRDGKGVKQDYSRARQWFEKAAAAGYAAAKKELTTLP